MFIYPFHTEYEALDKYFAMNFKCTVTEFSLDAIEKALVHDTSLGRRVVILLTSSANYVRAILVVLIQGLRKSTACAV